MPILTLLRRFLPPYRGQVALNIFFNLLSTVLSLFSFAAIIPVLRILFGISDLHASYTPLASALTLQDWLDALRSNLYFTLGRLIDTHGAAYVLFLLGLFLVLMTGLKCLSSWLAAFFMVPVRTGVLRDLRLLLYNKVVSLPVGFFTEERKGDIMSRMTSDVGEVESSIMSSLDIIFKDPVMILVYLLTLFVISWQLTLFVLVLLPVAGLLIGRVGRSLKRKSVVGQEQTADLVTLIARFADMAEKARNTFNRINRRYYLAHPVSEFLGTVLIAVLLWYGGGLILSDNSSIDAATFIYYLVIFYSIINPAKDLSKASYGVRKGLASLERIDRILNTSSAVREPAEPVEMQPFARDIVYDNVSFSYDGTHPVLCGISLTIPKGSMVALVGQSGSGKTTLTDLLPRFYDVTEGAVRIDGRDVRSFRMADLRSLMGIVSQEALLFNDTFFNNITFGVDTSQPAPDGLTWRQAVEKAARIANAHDFIMQTPDGYDTLVGDRGSRLSGGQRQRISIARAILKNPPVLILDEATSALDTESEKLVQQALENLMKDRTTLVVAHRLSTIRNADLICVLHEGRIVETGTHDTLYAKSGGYYRRLIDLQNSDTSSR